MKYDIETAEGEYQAGSNQSVLKNKLGIICMDDIFDAETELLYKLYCYVFEDEHISSFTFTTQSIQELHHKWLGNIYDWAGEFRTVNMSKSGFDFATAQVIDTLFHKFESDYLSKAHLLPTMDKETFIQYLAESHVEFILIHPFREGNGRLARLLLDIMSVHAGYGLLNYSLWDENKEFYFKSIQAGLNNDYQHMARLVRDIL